MQSLQAIPREIRYLGDRTIVIIIDAMMSKSELNAVRLVTNKIRVSPKIMVLFSVVLYTL